MAAFRDAFLNLTGGPNGRIDPEEVRVERVSASLFPLLGVQAAVGRTFLPEEDQPGRADYALLSHRAVGAAVRRATLRLSEKPIQTERPNSYRCGRTPSGVFGDGPQGGSLDAVGPKP